MKSPTIFVPGWIVRVAPFATWMNPLSVYVLSFVHVVFVVTSCVTSTLPPLPDAPVVAVNTDDALLVFDPRTAKTRYWYVVFSLRPLSVNVTVPGVVGA